MSKLLLESKLKNPFQNIYFIKWQINFLEHFTTFKIQA